MKSDEVKQTIIRLYYDEHKRPSEIALIIGKTPQSAIWAKYSTYNLI